MSDLNDLVDEVGRLTEVTTELIDTTNVSKQTLDEAVASASSDAAKAETAESKATPASVKAEAAQAGAEKARKDAEAIVYEGDSSLDPAPGNIPIADSNAKIHHGWLPDQSIPAPDFHLPLISDLRIEEGFGAADQIDVSPEQDGSVMVDLPTCSARCIREGEATYIHKAGVLATAQENEPRFETEGIRRDGLSTNLIVHSVEMTKGGWAGGSSTFVDAEMRAGIKIHKYRNTSTTIRGYVRQLKKTISAGQPMSLSAFVARGSEQKIRIVGDCINTGQVRVDGYFNFDTEEFEIGGASKGIQGIMIKKMAEGVYRIGMTTEPLTETEEDARFIIYTAFSTDVTDLSTVNVGGAQLEEGVISSYIPTEDVPKTRVEEQVDFLVDNNLPLGFGFTLACNWRAEEGNIGFRHVYQTSAGNSGVRYNVRGDGNMAAWLGGVGINLHAKVVDGEMHSHVFHVKKSGSRATVFTDGIESNEFGEPPYSNSVTVQLGGGLYGSPLFGNLRDFRIWCRPLTNEQIAALGAAQ